MAYPPGTPQAAQRVPDALPQLGLLELLLPSVEAIDRSASEVVASQAGLKAQIEGLQDELNAFNGLPDVGPMLEGYTARLVSAPPPPAARCAFVAESPAGELEEKGEPDECADQPGAGSCGSIRPRPPPAAVRRGGDLGGSSCGWNAAPHRGGR